MNGASNASKIMYVMSDRYKFERHCICGDSMVGEIAPQQLAEKVLGAWLQVHSGEGHAPTDAETVRRQVLRLAGKRRQGSRR